MVNIWITGGEEGCKLARECGAVAIVVDSCRASPTIVTLLDRGATEVMAVSEVSDARALAKAITNALLAGERKGLKLPGFDLGNSPLEVLREDVAGKAVVFTTTTGARRLVEAIGAAAILVGSPLNADSVAGLAGDMARTRGRDVVVIPAGLASDPSCYCSEDWYGAASIARSIPGTVVAQCREKLATLVSSIDREGLPALFRQSDHGKFLIELGFGEDVNYCARTNVNKVVPIVTGTLRLPSGALAARVISSDK